MAGDYHLIGSEAEGTYPELFFIDCNDRASSKGIRRLFVFDAERQSLKPTVTSHYVTAVCIDLAFSAQLTPLIQMRQPGLSCSTLGVAR